MSFRWPCEKSKSPRLLVSVRNLTESVSALRGGCDIIDIKEPHHGSLGMAAPAVIREIVACVRQESPGIMVTAALGEVVEHALRSPATIPTWDLPAVDLVKIGCAQLLATPNWRQVLTNVRHEVGRGMSGEIGWVGVSYVDAELAGAPPPQELVAEAIAAGCRGMLFDTYSKSGKRLLDWITVSQLRQFADDLHSQGLFMAVAGSLRSADLVHLAPVGADVIAVRGAACRQGARTDSIEETAVRAFRWAIEANLPRKL